MELSREAGLYILESSWVEILREGTSYKKESKELSSLMKERVLSEKEGEYSKTYKLRKHKVETMTRGEEERGVPRGYFEQYTYMEKHPQEKYLGLLLKVLEIGVGEIIGETKEIIIPYGLLLEDLSILSDVTKEGVREWSTSPRVSTIELNTEIKDEKVREIQGYKNRRGKKRVKGLEIRLDEEGQVELRVTYKNTKEYELEKELKLRMKLQGISISDYGDMKISKEDESRIKEGDTLKIPESVREVTLEGKEKLESKYVKLNKKQRTSIRKGLNWQRVSSNLREVLKEGYIIDFRGEELELSKEDIEELSGYRTYKNLIKIQGDTSKVNRLRNIQVEIEEERIKCKSLKYEGKSMKVLSKEAPHKWKTPEGISHKLEVRELKEYDTSSNKRSYKVKGTIIKRIELEVEEEETKESYKIEYEVKK